MSPVYTRAQREAMAAAFGQVGLTGRQVVELAAAGKLEHPNGAVLRPFHTTASTVRSEFRRARQRLARETGGTRLADLPARDATERMRRALAAAIEQEMDRMELEQAEGRSVLRSTGSKARRRLQSRTR